jgi:hypothetical protein
VAAVIAPTEITDVNIIDLRISAIPEFYTVILAIIMPEMNENLAGKSKLTLDYADKLNSHRRHPQHFTHAYAPSMAWPVQA